MRISRAQASDWRVLRELYQYNHPHDHKGPTARRWHSMTFVARDDTDGDRIMGFVTASYAGLKGSRHGTIHVFEITPEDRHLSPENDLMGTCVAWLEAQWCRKAYIPALHNHGFAGLARRLGAEAGGYGPTIPLSPKSPQWRWVLDPRTGIISPEAGPEGRPPGPPPKPFQLPRQVW
jgi:hypothetical protein